MSDQCQLCSKKATDELFIESWNNKKAKYSPLETIYLCKKHLDKFNEQVKAFLKARGRDE